MTMRLLVDVFVVVVVVDVVVVVISTSLLFANIVVVVVVTFLYGSPVNVVRSLLSLSSFVVVNFTGRHQSWETRGVDEVYRDRSS